MDPSSVKDGTFQITNGLRDWVAVRTELIDVCRNANLLVDAASLIAASLWQTRRGAALAESPTRGAHAGRPMQSLCRARQLPPDAALALFSLTAAAAASEGLAASNAALLAMLVPGLPFLTAPGSAASFAFAVPPLEGLTEPSLDILNTPSPVFAEASAAGATLLLVARRLDLVRGGISGDRN